MTDFANLVLGVDATGVEQGADALDHLTASGTRATGMAGGLTNATRATGMAAAQMASQAQSLAIATVGASNGFKSAGAMANNARIAMLDMTHVGINMTQMLASGVDPMRALVMESGRLATAVQYSSGGISGLIKQTAAWLGITKVTKDALLEETAVQAAASAAAVGGMAQRAAAAITAADTELAMAEASMRVAASAEEEAIAQTRLAAAHVRIAEAAAEATVAENALAVAQGRAAETAAASSARTVTSIGRMGFALGGLAVVAGVAFAGIHAFQSEVAQSGVLDKYAEGLRLTDEQIKKAGGSVKYLADGTREISGLTVSFGNIAQATFQILAERAGVTGVTIKSAFGSAFKWLGDFGKFTIALLLAGFAALIETLMTVGKDMVALATGNFDAMVNPLKAGKDQFFKSFDEINAGFDAIGKRAIDLQKQDLLDTSNSNKPKKPKSSKTSDHGLADALAELDAQIKGQLALADAYQVSDAAAIKAEAMQKAEEQAIRHKGDVAIFYEKELTLAITQRMADGAKLIADIHAQSAAQSVVNGLVEDGIIPVQRMDQALEEQSKKRTLQAALEVAEDEGKLDLAKKIREELGRLTHDQGVLNDELAHTAALKAIASKDDEITKLKLEADLIEASNRERAVRLAMLDAENEIRDKNIKGDDAVALKQKYIDAANATVTLTEGQAAYNIELTKTVDMLNLMAESAQNLGSLLGEAFGQQGAAIGSMISGLADWQAKEQEIHDWKLEALKTVAAGSKAANDIEAQAAQKSKNAQIQGFTSLLGAAKSMFKEHSVGYKAMEAAEKAYAIVQMISAAKSIIAGAAKMFSQLGVWAFPAVAAMVAVMAGLGFAGGGGSQTPPTSPEDLQKAQGTGTILGSPDAKSDSIANSLDLMSKNSVKGIDQGASMVRSLRSIEGGISSLTAAIARQLQLPGGTFDQSTLGLGTKKSLTYSPIWGLETKKVTKSLYDQGITINAASLQQILEQGVTGATYAVIEKVTKKSGFFGIGGSTKTSYSTQFGSLDPEVAKQFGLVIGDISKSIIEAGKMLGFDVEAALKTFQVQIGQISFKDMNADEIQKTLEAVFSKVADQMAGFAVAGLAEFQKAGEGLYETLMRVAKDFMTVGTALKSIGLVAPASIKAREALIDLAGGLDQFVSQINYYYENFLTQSEQSAFLQEQVNAAFAGLGISVPSSIAQFKALVAAQDLTTEAGQAMFNALMQIAPAFYNLETAADQAAAAAKAAADALAKQKTALQIDLLTAQGKATEALALKRKTELAAMDASLRGLQQQVWAAQDLAKAKDKLVTAYKRESQELQATIDKFRGFATNLREFRDTLLNTGNGADSYQASLVKLMKQAGLAQAGDEGALGGGLTSAAQSFLETATANAGSLQDVQRARALVMRSIDSAIGVADSKANIAEQQLAQLKTQVSALVDINESVQTVAEAIAELKALIPAPPSTGDGTTPGTGTGGGSGAGHGGRGVFRDLWERMHDRLGDIAAATEQTAVSANKTARVFRNADRGGAIAVATDADAPLDTTGVDGGSA